VIVTFIIQKDGSVAKARIARSVDPELDAEALRIVKAMPNWTPATVDLKHRTNHKVQCSMFKVQSSKF
jgi:periplasmic protein TonB